MKRWPPVPVELISRDDPFIRDNVVYFYETYPLKRPVKLADFFPQFTRITHFTYKGGSVGEIESKYRWRVVEGKTQLG